MAADGAWGFCGLRTLSLLSCLCWSIGTKPKFPGCSAVGCTCVRSSNAEKDAEGIREESGEGIVPVRNARSPAALCFIPV